MVTNNPNTYRSIFKATSLFGGLQVYQIIVSIIKSKFVAILIGPTGVGIQGLLQSGTELIRTLTNFGLAQSAVREVSQAFGENDPERIKLVSSVINKLVWATGILGMVVVMGLSPMLSKILFGNYDYSISFIFLSITLLFEQLSSGQKVILQGLRKLKDLAKASAWGSTVGLIISIPIYYLFGINGIVPTLILSSLMALILSWCYARNYLVDLTSVSRKQILQEGKSMLAMGIAMSVSNILITVCAFILKSYISNRGGSEVVGYYTAGFMIVTTYFSMIFNALATDYYPRLAAFNKDNERCRLLSNEQGEIATLIMSPLILICLVFMPLILQILYSDKFLEANDYVVWAVIGMLFKLASWLIAFQFIAKCETKLYIINETLLNAYTLAFSLLGYICFGLTGLGAAYSLSNFVYFIQVYLIAASRYQYSFSKRFLSVFSFQSLLIAICFIAVLQTSVVLRFIFGIIIILISTGASLYGLDKRIGLCTLLSKFKK